MKTIILALLLAFTINGLTKAQEISTGESFGNTLNMGIGVSYYEYIGHSIPVIHANYELNVAKNFTLAPFITVYSYENNYYWGNKNYPYRNYGYRQVVIPIGVKGAYYFDQIFMAGPKWDFYLAGSLGIAIRKTTWETGYYGETTVIQNGTSGLYLDGHIGTEYHFNNKLGMFLDLSSGISTFGLSVHF